MMMQKLDLIQPDDWHLHLRDGHYLKTTVPAVARCFARAMIMPNLKPAVVTVEQACAYQMRILAQIPKEYSFQPLMTLYLTDQTTPSLVAQAKKSGMIAAFKLYPAGVTTHSDAGVTRLDKIYPALAAMQEHDLPLLIHGETNHPEVDIFDREKYFLNEEMLQLIQKFPSLRMVLEHISTKIAADFVLESPQTLAATITAHHLLLNRNDLLSAGVRPHYYCLPILKRGTDQAALIKAATSGNPKFFLGTDSAPHAVNTKESACGCAGIFTSHAAIELYAHVFEKANALNQLEAFASKNGAVFYKLPFNTRTITLIKKPWTVADFLPFGDEKLKPFCANEILQWQVRGVSEIT